jgi:hypothetical protein
MLWCGGRRVTESNRKKKEGVEKECVRAIAKTILQTVRAHDAFTITPNKRTAQQVGLPYCRGLLPKKLATHVNPPEQGRAYSNGW